MKPIPLEPKDLIGQTFSSLICSYAGPEGSKNLMVWTTIPEGGVGLIHYEVRRKGEDNFETNVLREALAKYNEPF